MKKYLFLLFFVCVATISYSQSQCRTCNGHGKLLCATCGGGGVVYQQVYNPYYGIYQNVQYRCASCNGYGTLICSSCGGRGYVETNNSNSSNISFKGKHCTYTEGCDCSGFSPKTDGDEWEKAYCRKCGHKKSYHK